MRKIFSICSSFHFPQMNEITWANLLRREKEFGSCIFPSTFWGPDRTPFFVFVPVLSGEAVYVL